MKGAQLIYSFHARLVLALGVFIVSVLAVQYYLNTRAQSRTAEAIAAQEQALTTGIALGIESISSGEYMVDLRKKHPNIFTGQTAGRVSNILIIDGEERVEDSLDPRYNPEELPDGTTKYTPLTEVPLPPLVRSGDMPAEAVHLPAQLFTSAEPGAGEPRAVAIPAQTSKGTKHIIVVLGAAPAFRGNGVEFFLRSLKPLLPTFGVLLAAVLVMGLLVWRFTQPINDLSEGARRVAAGDLDFRVPAGRRDEIGMLAVGFNRMIEGVGKSRDLETRLHRAERTAIVGRLTSAVAHEIKNPLNYINLALDHLRSQLLPEDAEKRQIFLRLTEQIKAEVMRINRRITEFLNYARPSKLELRPIALRPVVEDALKLIEAQAAESGVPVVVEEEGELSVVMGDAEALRSVFTNLLINALQAIDGHGGRLTVQLGGDMSGGGGARVRIIDTGPGILPENLSQIFEPYFSTKETGTGLGLAIVKKVVEDHNGSISVTSMKGEGTTFTVTLPAAG